MANIFSQFIAVILLGFSLAIIVNISEGRYPIVLLFGASVLPLLAALFLVRRRRFEAAAALLAVILISLITIAGTLGEGIRQLGVLAYPAVLIISSLAVQKRTMALLTLYNIACVAWLMFGESFGIFTPAIPARSTPAGFVIVATILSTTAFMVRLITEALFDNNLRLEKELKERKETERALHESLLRQSAILENIPDLAWLKDEHSRFIAVNGPFGQACGLAPEDLLGKADIDIWPEELAQAYRQDDLEVMQTGARKSVEERLVDSAGRTSWVQTIKTPIFNDAGQVIGTAGIARDITQRRLIEDELRQSKALLLSVLNTIPIRVFWKDRDLKYLGCNQPFALDVGAQSPEEVIGKDDLQMAGREQAEAYRADDRQVIETGQPKLSYEEPQMTRDGSRIWLRSSKSPLRDADGRVWGVLGTYEDVTERKNIETALRDSEVRYRTIVESTSDLICRFLPDTTLTFVNSAYSQYFGKAPGELVGMRFLEMIPRTGWNAVQGQIDAIVARKQPYTYEHEVVTPDGGVRWQQWTDSPILDGRGQVVELQSVGRDITERRVAEQALQESERRFREMLQGVKLAGVMLDEAGRITFINDFLLHITGWAREEVLGQSWFDIFLPAELRAGVRSAFGRLMTGEQTTPHYENEILTRRAERRLIRWNNTVLFDSSRRIIGSASIGEDITERQRAEEMIRQSEERFREMAESIHEVFYLSDLTAPSMLYISPAYETIWGRSRQSLYEKPTSFIEAVHPEDVERVLAYLGRQRQTEGAQEEYRVIRPDGTVRWVWDRAVPIRGSQGRTDRMCGVVQDITERKQAEEALKENEAIFSSFLEHSPVYVFFKDKHIRSLRLSKNYELMLGMPIQDLLGKTMDDLFPSALAKSMVADDMRILQEGKRIHVVEEFNGRIYETTKFPVLKDGEPFILAGFTVDITERKQAEDAIRYAEQRYRGLFEEAPVMYVVTVNHDGTPIITDCNNTFLNTLGYSRAEVIQQPLADFYTTASRSHLMDEGGYQRALAGVFAGEERELVTRDGRVIKTLLRAIPEIDPQGSVYGTRAMFVDITERKHMEELLFEEKERAEVTLYSIGDAVITTDINAQVQYLNPVAETLTGWKLAGAMGKPLSEVFRIIEEGSRQVAINPVERCLREGRIVGLANHSILISRDGREYAIDDTAAPIRNRQGKIIGVVLVFHDVTEERRLSQQVAHDAMHDSLTGLVNRREFEKRLERALISTKENSISHILCYLDLDQFKIVNDTAGHTAGDELLKQISGLLGGLFRQRDTLARLGGDEFGLLLENCKLDHALIICNEILAKIRDFPFVWAGRSFQVGASIGVVPVTPQKDSVIQLLSQADIACYSAKDLGRGRAFVYQADDSETVQRHGEILQAARMRDAMLNDEFRLFCQPIVRLGGEAPEVTHYEVLLRMTDRDGRLTPPSVFIPSAERYGLMPAIDRWVIRQTFFTLQEYSALGAQITINLSGNSLDDETLLDYVLDQLREFAIPPERICFEITETAAIHHLGKAQRFIQGFRERSGKIALDDFGSGFSSFRYLKTLPVDYIKIDGSFVKDMLSNPGDQVMVEAITQVAHALGIEIIAEHASSWDIIGRLQQIGVEYAQGFGIGVPLPVESVLGNAARDGG